MSFYFSIFTPQFAENDLTFFIFQPYFFYWTRGRSNSGTSLVTIAGRPLVDAEANGDHRPKNTSLQSTGALHVEQTSKKIISNRFQFVLLDQSTPDWSIGGFQWLEIPFYGPCAALVFRK